MIGVIKVDVVVGAFVEQAGRFAQRALFVVDDGDDRDVLTGFDNHQAHFGDGR